MAQFHGASFIAAAIVRFLPEQQFGNFRTATVRIITVICLLLFFWATALVYIGFVLLFREKPLIFGLVSQCPVSKLSNR